MAALLDRLFGRPAAGNATPRDGAAPVLESHATGLLPALPGPGDSLGTPAPPDDAAGRRQRPLPLPGEVVSEALAQKVLHGWLQNRHQTLLPLTLNLRRLEAGKAALLARAMAAALLAGGRTPDEARTADALAWLGQAGGDVATGNVLRAALDRPEPLGPLLREAQSAGLAPLAYAVSLAAVDAGDQAGQLYLDYLAVRLALPPTVARSADRRFGRRYASAGSVREASAP